MHLLNRILGALLCAALHLYRWTISPALHALFPGSGCRFHPTCSSYALEAVRVHGPWLGTWLALRRVTRCHPWNPGGHDPVPQQHPCSDRKP